MWRVWPFLSVAMLIASATLLVAALFAIVVRPAASHGEIKLDTNVSNYTLDYCHANAVIAEFL